MKILFFVLAICMAATVALAGSMTWKTPVPSAADTQYYGTNEILKRQGAAMDETRDRIKKLGIFAGYTTQGN